MKLSQEFRVNVNTVKHSYCGKLLAFGYVQELTIVRNYDETTLVRTYCRGKIKAIDWSFDSDHILCVIADLHLVEVFCVSLSRWICAIHDAAAGLRAAVWSPSACHIITVARFAVRLSVWSLVGRSIAVIGTPLMKTNDKLSFSSDGKYLAVITGQNRGYKISLFSTSSWIVAGKINCSNKIKKPSTPLWSPNGFFLALWQTDELSKSFVEIYSVGNGKMVGNFKKNNNNKLVGISAVAWCPSSQFLFIGCRDDCIYVINYITWSVTYILKHKKVIEDHKSRVLSDVPNIYYNRPITLVSMIPSVLPLKLPGVHNIVFSRDGLYAASQTKLMPAVVWIWNLNKFSLNTIFILKNGVTDLKWSYTKSNLLICSKSHQVIIWKPNDPEQSSIISLGLKHKSEIQKGSWLPSKIDEVPKFLIFTNSHIRFVSNY